MKTVLHFNVTFVPKCRTNEFNVVRAHYVAVVVAEAHLGAKDNPYRGLGVSEHRAIERAKEVWALMQMPPVQSCEAGTGRVYRFYYDPNTLMAVLLEEEAEARQQDRWMARQAWEKALQAELDLHLKPLKLNTHCVDLRVHNETALITVTGVNVWNSHWHRHETVIRSRTFWTKRYGGFNWVGICEAAKNVDAYWNQRAEQDNQARTYKSRAEKVLKEAGVGEYGSMVGAVGTSVHFKFAVSDLTLVVKVIKALRDTGLKVE